MSRLRYGRAIVLIVGITSSNVTLPNDRRVPPRYETRANCISINKLVAPHGVDQGVVKSKYVLSPGKYCLQHDIVARTFVAPIHPEKGFFVAVDEHGWFDAILNIESAGVTVDLGGKTIRSRQEGNGIGLSGVQAAYPRRLQKNLNNDDIAIGSWDGLFRHITVKNGKLDIKIGPGIIMYNSDGISDYDEPRRDFRNRFYRVAQDGYISTQFILENLDITVKKEGILLEGNDNIIRNCKIRVKGANAIKIFGNNVQILNNEIIVGSDEEMTPSSAPIMLRDGDNALISGNKITIKGAKSNRPVQAISLRDSRNVRIENNQFVGAQIIYKAFDIKSSTKASNNSLKAKAGWLD